MTTDITLKTAGYNSRGSLWDAFLGDEKIVKRAIEPNYKTCRELVARGITGRAMFWFEDKEVLIIRDIEKAAQLTVEECRKNGLRTRKFKAYEEA